MSNRLSDLEHDLLLNHTFVRMLLWSKKQKMPAAFETQDTKILSNHQGCLKSKEGTNMKQKEQDSQSKWGKAIRKAWKPC